MKKLLIFGFAFALLTVLLSLPAQADGTVSLGFSPVTQNAVLPGTVSVDVVISGLGDYTSPSLGAFDFDVNYDSTILAFDSYTLGPYLGDLSLFEALDWSNGLVSPGDVNLSELSLLDPSSLDALQPDSFTLATLTFDTIASGTSLLSLPDVTLGDGNGDSLLATANPGSITVGSLCPVPEPPTWLLLCSVLAGLAAFSAVRKKRQKGLIWMRSK